MEGLTIHVSQDKYDGEGECVMPFALLGYMEVLDFRLIHHKDSSHEGVDHGGVRQAGKRNANMPHLLASEIEFSRAMNEFACELAIVHKNPEKCLRRDARL